MAKEYFPRVNKNETKWGKMNNFFNSKINLFIFKNTKLCESRQKNGKSTHHNYDNNKYEKNTSYMYKVKYKQVSI